MARLIALQGQDKIKLLSGYKNRRKNNGSLYETSQRRATSS